MIVRHSIYKVWLYKAQFLPQLAIVSGAYHAEAIQKVFAVCLSCHLNTIAVVVIVIISVSE